MKKLIHIKLVLFVCVLNCTYNYAQTSNGMHSQLMNLNSTGGNLQNNDGSISFSVGQVFFHYLNNSQTTVLAGVQQPKISNVFLGLEKPEYKVSILAYPNPLTDFLTLEIKDLNQYNLTYTIFDQNGSRLKHEDIKTEKTRIEFQKFQTAAYFVTIRNMGKLIKTFKILKT